jgi:hypothetical protein
MKSMIDLLLAGLASIVTPGLLLVKPGDAARRDSISALWYGATPLEAEFAAVAITSPHPFH